MMKIEVGLVCATCNVDDEPVQMVPAGGYDSPIPAEYYKCPSCNTVVELQISVFPHIDCYDPETLIEKECQ